MSNNPKETSIPASVRRAPDLSQLAAQETQQEAAAPAAGSSWRFDLQTPEDFQHYVQLSSQGVVIFCLYAQHSPASLETLSQLEELVNAAAGNLLLAAVDISRLPEIAQAFQVQSVPAAIAIVAGQPAPLFNSQVSQEQLQDLVQQLLSIAAQQQLPGGFAPATAAEDEPLDPLHQEALDALERHDYAGAQQAYGKALKENPADRQAKYGLAQVNLLARVEKLDAGQQRQAAAADPTDLEAQFNVADLDLAAGHVEDAFNRLLSLFKQVEADQKNRVRQRLLELFDVVGLDDARVVKARTALMTALF
ncbi:MAG: tetratricopeptide repeat protein [Rothia sp. (in: high G+C Gram-positive bacteria)]|nr:tetratricopeptide repeat protein [Rothia sp. (in: high G+C Gram-positive bacteria)]